MRNISWKSGLEGLTNNTEIAAVFLWVNIIDKRKKQDKPVLAFPFFTIEIANTIGKKKIKIDQREKILLHCLFFAEQSEHSHQVCSAYLI